MRSVTVPISLHILSSLYPKGPPNLIDTPVHRSTLPLCLQTAGVGTQGAQSAVRRKNPRTAHAVPIWSGNSNVLSVVVVGVSQALGGTSSLHPGFHAP